MKSDFVKCIVKVSDVFVGKCESVRGGSMLPTFRSKLDLALAGNLPYQTHQRFLHASRPYVLAPFIGVISCV